MRSHMLSANGNSALLRLSQQILSTFRVGLRNELQLVRIEHAHSLAVNRESCY